MINMLNDQAEDLEGKWDVAELPAQENNISVMGGSNFSVFHNTENVEASLEFISYMSEVDTQLEWLEISNTLPSRMEAWEDPVFEENPTLAVFGDQLESTKAQPQVEEWAEISEGMLNRLEEVIRGGEDLDTKLDEFREETDQILEK
ncbi:extracellular solute-binding protein [Alteribacillus sp. HJP-4]|uniref:extracellular solute-binding protein n=1 Tax=Alteribacillus sp. HJP-4 TaxID=2775394 RepID=UPI0035CD1A03